MTLIPQQKYCYRCKQYYNWNPDVGYMFCPRCGLTGISKRKKRSTKLRRQKLFKEYSGSRPTKT